MIILKHIPQWSILRLYLFNLFFNDFVNIQHTHQLSIILMTIHLAKSETFYGRLLRMPTLKQNQQSYLLYDDRKFQFMYTSMNTCFQCEYIRIKSEESITHTQRRVYYTHLEKSQLHTLQEESITHTPRRVHYTHTPRRVHYTQSEKIPSRQMLFYSTNYWQQFWVQFVV